VTSPHLRLNAVTRNHNHGNVVGPWHVLFTGIKGGWALSLFEYNLCLFFFFSAERGNCRESVLWRDESSALLRLATLVPPYHCSLQFPLAVVSWERFLCLFEPLVEWGVNLCLVALGLDNLCLFFLFSIVRENCGESMFWRGDERSTLLDWPP
jgi:hypothetical protein